MAVDDLLYDLAIIMLVVILGIYAGGYFLPPAYVAKTRSVINRRPDQLFDMLIDFPKWPRWNKEASNAARMPDHNGHQVWLLGEQILEIVQIVPLVNGVGQIFTRLHDAKSPVQGTWTWLIEPEGGGATLTIIEEATIKSPVWRFLAKYLFGHHHTGKSLLFQIGNSIEQEIHPEEVKEKLS